MLTANNVSYYQLIVSLPADLEIERDTGIDSYLTASRGIKSSPGLDRGVADMVSCRIQGDINAIRRTVYLRATRS